MPNYDGSSFLKNIFGTSIEKFLRHPHKRYLHCKKFKKSKSESHDLSMTNIFLGIKENMNYIGPNHLPTTLMLDICQDIDRLSSFSIKYM